MATTFDPISAGLPPGPGRHRDLGSSADAHEPFLDPIKTLAQCCDVEVVKHVLVQGRWLVENHWLTVWDDEELLADVCASTDAAWSRFADY